MNSLDIYQNKKLSNFNILNDIEFTYPESIKHLQINMFQRKVSIFKNLESLQINTCNLEINDLVEFKKLKKLRINCLDSSQLNRIERLYAANNERESDLQIFLWGVRLNYTVDLNRYRWNYRLKDQIYHYRTYTGLGFQIAYYNQLDDDLNFVKDMDYHSLLDLYDYHHHSQPSDLLHKFTNIQYLKVKSKIEDEKQLVHFIKGSPGLLRLGIRESNLSQQFYDHLNEICSLSRLDIYKENAELDFEFILKMRELKELHTDHDIMINKNLNLNRLKYLREIKFRIKDKEIEIRRRGKDRYAYHNYQMLGIEYYEVSLDVLNASFILLRTKYSEIQQ